VLRGLKLANASPSLNALESCLAGEYRQHFQHPAQGQAILLAHLGRLRETKRRYDYAARTCPPVPGLTGSPNLRTSPPPALASIFRRLLPEQSLDPPSIVDFPQVDYRGITHLPN